MRGKERQTQRGGWKEDYIKAKQNTGETAVGLMEFMQGMAGDVKRNQLKTWLKYNQVMINGIVTRQFDAPVEPGQWVEINFTRPFVVFSHHRMSIVYEDDHIIVVNKGYGLLSMGTDSVRKDETAYTILKEYVKKKHPMNKIFIIHRLDRDTSGLMMFAKSMEAKEAMQHNWNNMVISRNYVAVVEGVVEQKSGVIRSWLNETSQYEVYSTQEEGNGQLAITRYNVLDAGHGYSLVEFSLDTGRKNQIRVHAAQELKHPIVGDRKYGAASSPIHRLALHARTLRFAHPITREDMNFELPIPSRFAGLVKYGTNKNK